MSKSTVVVAVDDTDPRMQYSGSWSSASHTSNLGYGGLALNESVHVGTKAGSSVTFEFEGSAIGFFGSLDSTTRESLPSYTCLVDGQPFGGRNYPYSFWGPTNQYPLCEHIDLEDGFHTAALTINDIHADSSSPDGVPFLLDYVGYWPSEGVNPSGLTQQVQFNDTRISLSEGWSVYGVFQYHHYITQHSSTVTVSFDAQSLVMYAFIPNGTFTSGTGSYVLDDDPPVEFTIPASKSVSSNYWNHPYFNLTGLSQGNHTLVVTDNTYHEHTSEGPSPMTLSYFQIVGHDDSNGSSSILTEPSKLSVGAIAGIAVGGVAVAGVGVFFILYFWIFRPRKVKDKSSFGRRPSGVTKEKRRINLNDASVRPYRAPLPGSPVGIPGIPEPFQQHPTSPTTPTSATPFVTYQKPRTSITNQDFYPHTREPHTPLQPLRPSFDGTVKTVMMPPQPPQPPPTPPPPPPPPPPPGLGTIPMTIPAYNASDPSLNRSPSSGSALSSMGHSRLSAFVAAAQNPTQPDLGRTDSTYGNRMSWHSQGGGPQQQQNRRRSTSRTSVSNRQRPGSANSTSSKYPSASHRRPGSSGSTAAAQDASAQTRYITHTDSGVRMGWRDPREVQEERLDPTNVRYVDVPPEYKET